MTSQGRRQPEAARRAFHLKSAPRDPIITSGLSFGFHPRARSSIGQSIGLRNRGLGVRIPPGVPAIRRSRAAPCERNYSTRQSVRALAIGSCPRSTCCQMLPRVAALGRQSAEKGAEESWAGKPGARSRADDFGYKMRRNGEGQHIISNERRGNRVTPLK